MEKSVRVTVIIPCRESEDASVTLHSLARGTMHYYKVIVVKDQGKGANWARNEGFKQVDTEFVLFSDNDIDFKSHALEKMVKVLDMSKASYCYGRYLLGDQIWSHQDWNPQLLKKINYISTMSLIRTKDLPNPPFDDNLKRLQDWDLWLNLLEQGKRGIYCNDLIFTTQIKPGITFDSKLNPFTNHEEARQIISKKHNLKLGIQAWVQF